MDASPHESSMPRMRRSDLIVHLDRLLEPGRFRDYGPNGLQVEGNDEITCLATAATASLAACQAAVAAGAQALLVHHGLFWGGETRVVGPLAKRLAVLLGNGVSLIAYHMPLDAHAEIGNNAVALRLLGCEDIGVFGEKDLGRKGRLIQPLPIAAFIARCGEAFAHPVVHCPGGSPLVRTIGVVTGGGQAWLTAASIAGCDAFVTGEASEQSWHEAAELGCHLLACGHHATENHAVHRLGADLAHRFGLRQVTIAGDNPI